MNFEYLTTGEILPKHTTETTLGLVEKVRAYVAERRRELETSSNAEELARKRLQELGYLDENGEIAESYKRGIPKR